MSTDFVIMVKPVGSLCNMRCGYCYYLEKDRSDSLRMTDDLLEVFVRDYINSTVCPDVRFTWHGGEPTLAGLDFFRLAVKLQNRYIQNGRTCWNNLQTNGLLLDDEWCDFLAANHFDVGLSLDGAETLHDEYRRDAGGNGTYARAKAAVKHLMTRGLKPDLLCTVNAVTVKEPVAVYRKLRSLGTGWMQFIPVVRRDANGNLTSDSVNGKDYGNFLRIVFDQWVCNDLGLSQVQLFAETAAVKCGGVAGLCFMTPSCGHVLVVEQDGDVYSCDHFVDEAHHIGNIKTSRLQTLVESARQINFGNAKRDSLSPECLACQWIVYCNGGCPKDRFAVNEGENPGLNILCEGLRGFFSYADKTLGRIIELRKNGASPSEVMTSLRAERQTKWKGVGRNSLCPCGSGRKAKNCCWEQRVNM